MKSKRQSQQNKRKRQKLLGNLTWAGLGLAVLAVLGYAVFAGTRPAAGQSVQVMADSSHVAEGSDPGPYNSDPPTSGRHYESTFTAGFYEENSAETQNQYPEGYLVHNLEHGYVIFWYDCEELESGSCEELKSEIQAVMDEYGGTKLIAFPRAALDVPVVMTTWGQMQRFEQFDPQAAGTFIARNRNKAPEPEAP